VLEAQYIPNAKRIAEGVRATFGRPVSGG